MEIYKILEDYLNKYASECLHKLKDASPDSEDLKAALNVVNQVEGGGVNPSYDKELTRLMYISKFTYFYGGLYAVMYKAIFELDQLKEIISNPDRELKVLSVGCANQIDLWGLLFAREQLNINNKIKYVGCEIEENWKDMIIFDSNILMAEKCEAEFHFGVDEGDIGKFLDKNNENFDIVFLPSVFNELDESTKNKVKELLSPATTVCGITCHSDEDVSGLELDTLDSITNGYKYKKRTINEAVNSIFGGDGLLYSMPKKIDEYKNYVTKEYTSEDGTKTLTHNQPMVNCEPHLTFKILGHNR